MPDPARPPRRGVADARRAGAGPDPELLCPPGRRRPRACWPTSDDEAFEYFDATRRRGRSAGQPLRRRARRARVGRAAAAARRRAEARTHLERAVELLRRSAPRCSPSGRPGAARRRRRRRRATWRRTSCSRRTSCRSPGWSSAARPTATSPPSCSSARAPSRPTSRRSSASSASATARSSPPRLGRPRAPALNFPTWGQRRRCVGSAIIFEFGDCAVDPGRFELRRGGVMQHVEPQVFDVARLPDPPSGSGRHQGGVARQRLGRSVRERVGLGESRPQVGAPRRRRRRRLPA